MLGFDLNNAANLQVFASLIQRYSSEFEEIEKIGSGGFSTVYKVKSKRDHKFYALKIVKIKPSEYKNDVADYLERVLSEAKVLAALNHPNILSYAGCWIEADACMDSPS